MVDLDLQETIRRAVRTCTYTFKLMQKSAFLKLKDGNEQGYRDDMQFCQGYNIGSLPLHGVAHASGVAVEFENEYTKGWNYPWLEEDEVIKQLDQDLEELYEELKDRIPDA